MSNNPHNVAIVGTGNFAIDTHALCRSFAFNVAFFIDEFRKDNFLDLPTIKAEQLCANKLKTIQKYIIAISNPEHNQAARKRLIKAGCNEHKIVNLRAETDLHIMRFIFEAHSQAAINYFADTNMKTIQTLEERFLSENWLNVANNIDKNKKTIALGLYARGSGFRKHIEPIVPFLQRNYNVICLTDERIIDAKTFPSPLYIGAETVRNRDIADLVISASHSEFSPRATPQVSFSHIIYDFSASDCSYASHIELSDTHYIFASSEPCLNYYRNIIKKYDLTNRVCLIPGGYPRLDKNIEVIDNYHGEIDSILYAPTYSLVKYKGHSLASSLNHAKSILESLCSAFPAYKIIFRPHPSDLKLYQLNRCDDVGKALANAIDFCKQHPQCELSETAESYLESFSRSRLMISDISSSAFTFPFSTCRPTIFFSPHDKELTASIEKGFGGKEFMNDREKVGLVASSLTHLIHCVGKILANKLLTAKEIDDFRRLKTYNLGKSKKYFEDNFDYIVNNKKHPQWHYFNW